MPALLLGQQLLRSEPWGPACIDSVARVLHHPVSSINGLQGSTYLKLFLTTILPHNSYATLVHCITLSEPQKGL